MQRKDKVIKFINNLFSNHEIALSRTSNLQNLNNLLKKIKVYNLGYDLVRIGQQNDGGYLVPNIIDQIDYCFSPGVGNTTKFEEELINKGVRKCFLADGTLEFISTNPKIEFLKKNLSSIDNKNQINLETWVNEKLEASEQNNLLLQMDIEGSEYEIINSTSNKFLNKFKIIIIEFHYLEKLFVDFGFKIIAPIFNKILDSFDIAHIHPNNCCGEYKYKNILIPSVMEFTFLRKDISLFKKQLDNFPHKYDSVNKKKFKEIILPKIFYK